MSSGLAIIDRAPEKPKFGSPCNGCGFCCAAELCWIARRNYGEDFPAPCPEMRFHDGRFWCGLVEDATEIGRDDSFRLVLGIGVGCDADDFNTPGDSP